jgi:hypothetical protein
LTGAVLKQLEADMEAADVHRVRGIQRSTLGGDADDVEEA